MSSPRENHPRVILERRTREVHDELLEIEARIRVLQTEMHKAARPGSNGHRLNGSDTPTTAGEADFFAPHNAAPSTARVSPQNTQARKAFYLRSGSVQRLTPLRFERRIARNRAIAWCAIASLMLLLTILFVINWLRQ